jgi:RHH-type proline utilization regulon transcriptional repressor/proline dehydrogenase/delta 1-pyrroline-5-carboxylate dehydrogenase
VGEPVIRIAVGRAMKELGAQFVLGESIRGAMKRARIKEASGYTYSYDMLGEAALTARDAAAFKASYADAISQLSVVCSADDIRDNPGISIKLSALHPRYEVGQRSRVMAELVPHTLDLARQAKAANMGLNIDAEEADRLDLSLDVIEAVLSDPSLAGWDGFGVVVQAYGKRAADTLDWLHALATGLDRKIMVRLVKGAYWDSEIKRAQVEGLEGFPVFTRKAATDVRPQIAGNDGQDLSAIRHPQRPFRCGDPRIGERHTQFRISAPSRHGREPARHRLEGTRYPLSDLRAGGRSPGSTCLLGATLAGKRRERVLRQPDC